MNDDYDDDEFMTKRQSRAEAERRRRHAIRTRRLRRRRRIRRILRLALIAVLVIVVVVTVLMVRNYNTGSRHDQRGITAYENGDYETASAEFKEAVSYDSENADYYIHLGMTYIEEKLYSEALGYFNQAEECAKSSEQTATVNRGRGIVYLYEGDYASAAGWFDEVLQTEDISDTLRVDTLYYKAEAEDKAGNYDEAVSCYTDILSVEEDAGALMLRGLVYAKMGDYGLAENDLYNAIDQSRKSYVVYRALYSALTAQGKYTESWDVLEQALELPGSSGEDYFNRGMIYMDLEDYEDAEDMLNASYDKGYGAALLGLGEVSVRRGEYTDAAAYYETYFEKYGSDDAALLSKAYNQYAVCLIALERYEEAAQACEAGLKYNIRECDAALCFNLISAYEHMARWEDAYNLAKEYTEKYPSDEQGIREYEFLAGRVSG